MDSQFFKTEDGRWLNISYIKVLGLLEDLGENPTPKNKFFPERLRQAKVHLGEVTIALSEKDRVRLDMFLERHKVSA